jgi:hypothetical protein
VNIRNPQVHVLLSLADTCQVCLVSLKTGRTTYNPSVNQTREIIAFPSAWRLWRGLVTSCRYVQKRVILARKLDGNVSQCVARYDRLKQVVDYGLTGFSRIKSSLHLQ